MLRVSIDELKWHEGHGVYLHQETPFTGIAFELGRTGTLEAETEYLDGLRHGLQKMWYPDGAIASEGTFQNDVIHGTFREWHPDGTLALEQVGEFGILLSEKAWDERGQVVKEYSIDVGGGDWRALEFQRELARQRFRTE